MTTDEDDDDDLLLPVAMNETNKFALDSFTDDDSNEHSTENLDELKTNLQNKLIIDESPSIVAVE